MRAERQQWPCAAARRCPKRGAALWRRGRPQRHDPARARHHPWCACTGGVGCRAGLEEGGQDPHTPDRPRRRRGGGAAGRAGVCFTHTHMPAPAAQCPGQLPTTTAAPERSEGLRLASPSGQRNAISTTNTTTGAPPGGGTPTDDGSRTHTAFRPLYVWRKKRRPVWRSEHGSGRPSETDKQDAILRRLGLGRGGPTGV